MMTTTNKPALSEKPFVVKEVPVKAAGVPYSKTLRSQFPFLWKICLVYGICYLLSAYRNLDGIGSGIFAFISACFILLIAKRLKTYPQPEETLSITFSAESVFYFVAAVLISFSSCITDNPFFLFFNHVGSFLLFSIACLKLFYHDKQWDFGKYTAILFSFWIQILEVIPTPFRDFKAHHKTPNKKMPESVRYVCIGTLCGLPVLAITTLLLGSADRVFSDLLESIFNFDALFQWMFENLPENIILLPCCFVCYTLLLYLVMAALCKGGLKEEVKKPKKHGALIAVTMFVMIDVVYVIFSGIQFMCLFTGNIPETYEYAEYAREGFFELLFVALINFFLVLFCNKHFAKNTALQVTMTITCLCTYVMILSSAYRMRMYIHAYHLTFLRVFVLWFLFMLSFFMLGTLISIYKESWNSFRYCLFILTCFYTILVLSNIDSQIAKYNVAQFEKDINYGQSLEENVPLLRNYLPDDYEYSKAYASVLSGLRAKHGKTLGSSNLYTIDSYLQLTEHFYEYDYTRSDSEDYVLVENAAIYDPDIPNSIFMWKHFNFMENACYKRCE